MREIKLGESTGRTVVFPIRTHAEIDAHFKICPMPCHDSALIGSQRNRHAFSNVTLSILFKEIYEAAGICTSSPVRHDLMSVEVDILHNAHLISTLVSSVENLSLPQPAFMNDLGYPKGLCSRAGLGDLRVARRDDADPKSVWLPMCIMISYYIRCAEAAHQFVGP
jgi:hypothetical protein